MALAVKLDNHTSAPMMYLLHHALNVMSGSGPLGKGELILNAILQVTGAQSGILEWGTDLKPNKVVNSSNPTLLVWLDELHNSGKCATAGRYFARTWQPDAYSRLSLCWVDEPNSELLQSIDEDQFVLRLICQLLSNLQKLEVGQYATQRAMKFHAILAETLEWLSHLEHEKQHSFSDESVFLGLLTRVRIVCEVGSAAIRLFRRDGSHFYWVSQNLLESDLEKALLDKPNTRESILFWNAQEFPNVSFVELSIVTQTGLRARIYLRQRQQQQEPDFSWHNIANAHQLATLTFRSLENIELREDLKLSNQFLAIEREQHKKLIAELDTTQQQLQHTDKLASLGQLAAGVAHEINNPVSFLGSNINTLNSFHSALQGLLVKVQNLQEKNMIELDDSERQVLIDSSDMIDLIGESKEGLGRVKQIVQDLRNFSRNSDVAMQMVDLHQCLDSTLNIMRYEYKHKADIIKHYGDIPLVHCSMGQVNQVFLNILVNAAQAIPDRGVITIKTGFEHTWVYVRIEDNGAGISKENLERIFDPFFTTKPMGSGTGLGLSLSFGIIQRHHGHIEVESELGKGTCFTLRLPVIQPDEDYAP